MVTLDALRPGQSVIYAETGSLARLRVKEPGDPQVAAADLTWQAAVRGEVDLLQRRVGGGFQYLAIRRRQVDRQPAQPHYQEIAVRRTKKAA